MCHTSPVLWTEGCNVRSRDFSVLCESPSLPNLKSRNVMPPACAAELEACIKISSSSGALETLACGAERTGMPGND